MNGEEGVLCFLDNCTSITRLRSIAEAGRIELVSTTTARDEEWVAASDGLLAAAARGLYRRLCPDGQFGDDEILPNVAAWSFQVLSPIVVEHRDDEGLSLVEEGPHRSFLELQEQKEEDRRRVREQNSSHGEERPVSSQVVPNDPFQGPGHFPLSTASPHPPPFPPAVTDHLALNRPRYPFVLPPFPFCSWNDN